MTPSKLAIPDDVALRARLDREHEGASHLQACQYALKLAAHILGLIEYQDEGTVKEGFLLNEQWQQGKVRMADVRRASFMIHKLAKASDNTVVATALRVAGHAVAAAHVKQHAMVASDYAVKVIALLHRDAMEAVRQERLWQISQLQEIKRPHSSI